MKVWAVRRRVNGRYVRVGNRHVGTREDMARRFPGCEVKHWVNGPWRAA